MNWRDPGVLVLAAVCAGLLLMPGGGLMGPLTWFGGANPTRVLAMAGVIFCAVYFGTLKFWELLTGDKLQRPLPQILALFLAVRLTVDCARMLMWW